MIKSIEFKKLKGLSNVKIHFSETLTAIMGVNGIGKTTVIHALACLYQPSNINNSNYKFSQFFTPNRDAQWAGSSFTAIFDSSNSSQKKSKSSIEYSKSIDRWAPKYNRRPERDVFYMGIDTCIPEIELNKSLSYIDYKTENKEDKISLRILKDAAYIMNINYTHLTENKGNKKNYIGVEKDKKIKYSALSMGAGEQRLLKVLEIVHNAPAYSLIIIDEIDLLMHETALDKLIRKLHEISESKKLQIVFTTHSLVFKRLTNFVKIQFISKIPNTSSLQVYDQITNELNFLITENREIQNQIYVEDSFAKEIVRYIVKKYNMSSVTKIDIFGSISNSYTLAAGFVLANQSNISFDNILIVQDGDKDTQKEEKIKQIKNRLSGNEVNGDDKRNKALSLITSFCLPENKNPEEFIHSLLVKYNDIENEIIQASKEIYAVNNNHEWISRVKKKLDYSDETLVNSIISLVKNDEDWLAYIKPIEEWVKSKKITQPGVAGGD